MRMGANKKHASRVCAARVALGSALLVGCWQTASSQDRFGGSLAVTSDYVYRGISQSRGRVAYQAGAHVRLPAQWQVGVWGSTIETFEREGTPIEATGFVARAWTLGQDWSLRASYTHYAYFGVRTVSSPDYDEISATLSFRSQLSLAASWSPNAVSYGSPQQYVYPYLTPERRDSTAALEVAWLQPVWRRWAATVGAGYHDVSNLYRGGYAYWHIGVLGAFGPFELDLLHIGSDGDARRIFGPQVTGQRWSALARWRF